MNQIEETNQELNESVFSSEKTQFQKRDGEIIKLIYEHDGVVAKRHIKEIFWPESSWRAMEQRLAKLANLDFIIWPEKEHYRIHPIPEPVCWLGWRGITYIAGQHGIELLPPPATNEYQLRKYQHELRKHGVSWVREPRWSLLTHDIAIMDVKLAFIKNIETLEGLQLANWIPEGVFRSNPDVIHFSYFDRDGNTKHGKKGVLPDAYFEIINEDLKNKGVPHRIRFLLEIDMSTHDNPSFGREKVAPGIAYIRSPEYKARFGYNRGYWLVITNGGDIRLRNLVHQTRDIARSDISLFFFSTLEEILSTNPINSLIWRQKSSQELIALLPGFSEEKG